VQGFDSAELTVGAFDLGFVHPTGYPLYMLVFVHPTGYPLYMLVGRLFTPIPWMDVGWRMNLMSAVFASLAVGLLFKLIYQHNKNFWASLTAASLFITAPAFWSQAIRAEVYSLHIFLVVAALYTWFRAQRNEDIRLYYLAYIFLGLAAANHVTSLLLWAAVLICSIWSSPKLRRSTIPANIVGLAQTVLIYLYFPIRSQAALQIDYIRPYFQVNPGSLEGLWWMVSGQAFRCLVLPGSGIDSIFGEIIKLAGLIWEGTLGVGLIFGFWGWFSLRKTNWLWNLLLTLYFAANLAMFILYNAIDKEVMFIPIYLVITIWAGVGINNLVKWIASAMDHARFETVNIILNSALLVVVFTGLVLDWPNISLRNDRRAYEFAGEIISQVEPSTTIVSHWATASVFDYLILVEGQRPDVTSVNVDFYFLGIQRACQPVSNQVLLEEGWISRLEKLSIQNRLCFIEPLHDLPQGLSWQENGSCWQLSND